MTFDILALIVFLNLMATVVLWREAVRKPPKLKKKFLTALLTSEPVVPKHQPPKVLGEDFPSLITEEDRLFFDDFTDFAGVVNWWLADKDVGRSWRLQELPETELGLTFYDEPHFGRRYGIFHNQVRVGALEVSPGFPYEAENRSVGATIELDFVRLLRFDTIVEFFDDIAMHICDHDQNTNGYSQPKHEIVHALMKVIWQTQEISEFGMGSEDLGQLQLRLEGQASWYFVRREALRKQQAAA